MHNILHLTFQRFVPDGERAVLARLVRRTLGKIPGGQSVKDAAGGGHGSAGERDHSNVQHKRYCTDGLILSLSSSGSIHLQDTPLTIGQMQGKFQFEVMYGGYVNDLQTCAAGRLCCF